MVLINNLTIDEINAALLHLQRSQTEVVGGEKGNTVQNITIQNSGGSYTQGTDYSTVIAVIQNRLEELGLSQSEIEARVSEVERLLSELNESKVVNLRYDGQTGFLYLDFQNGDFLSVQITSQNISLTLDESTNELTLIMGNQTKVVTLPYIKTSEKGVANGVATLDSAGRVPYSQLPSSAMEFLGEWDASTNTPHLADGTGDNGDFYVVSTGGTVNFGTQAEPRNITFYPNDRVIYEGSSDEWKRLPAGEVSSVNGMSGDVVLTANDINYDSNTTIKQKIDAITPVQADWEETNSSDPAYIKNKIPIWITSGTADDNMTPIDSVTSGSLRPVTSNAVAQALNPTTTTIIESTNKRTVSITSGRTDWWGMTSYPAPALPSGKRLIRTFAKCSNVNTAVFVANFNDVNPCIVTVCDETATVQIWLCLEVADL